MASAPKTNSFTVAPGRTVGGKAPGEQVDLTDDEYKRLFDLGFVLDENGNRAGYEEGPKTVAGVEIKEI